MEHLELRMLLAADVILGPGNTEQRVTVPAELRRDELEQESDPRDRRITNNTLDTAEPLELGFDQGEYRAIDIRGELIEPSSIGSDTSSEIAQPNAVPPIPAIEDGSILIANQVNHRSGAPIRITGTIGDSPGGFTDGDYYELEELRAGQTITAHLDTGGDIAVILYDEFGQIQITGDAINPMVSNDVFISYPVEEDGSYYLAVVPYTGAASTFVPPLNPMDETTVQAGGGGDYIFTVGVDAVDIDFYAVDLTPGDIIGIHGIGAANLLSIFTPEQELMFRTGEHTRSDLPAASPLPGNPGTSSLAYVATEPGTHYLAVEGFQWSKYLLEARIFRPAIESAPPGTRQILFIDFNGAQINPDVFDPAGNQELRELGPMRDFLSNWGITDESRLISKILNVVERDFNQTLKLSNPNAGVKILNSRDHADPFGQPYVSRVIVGGTQNQSTIATVGVASSVDVGNFDMEETALVLLDLLSGPDTEPVSLNRFQVARGSSKLDLVAEGVGGIIVHEAGHFFGAYHTDRDNNVEARMDTGGIIEKVIGVGDDKIFGTVDDQLVTFVADEFEHGEERGFVGIQDVRGMLAHVLVSGKGIDVTERQDLVGLVFDDANGNGVQDGGEGGVSGVRVYVDVNQDAEFGIGEPTILSDESGNFSIPGISRTSDVQLRVATGSEQTLTSPEGGVITIESAADLPNVAFGVRTVTGGGVDFGDAPPSYGVASHEIQTGIHLGSRVDGELASEENDGVDDDGISLSGLVPGNTATVAISATTGEFSPAVVNGWVDFNLDGRFSSSERIVSDVQVEGSKSISFEVPQDAILGTTWSRFRFGYTRGIGPTGASGAGEVEDYQVRITSSDGGGGNGGGGNQLGPDATNDVFAVDHNAQNVTLNVLANDAAGSAAISISSVSGSGQGGIVQVAADGLSLVYSPAIGFEGTDSFSYTITNNFGSDAATVSVDVAGPSDNGGGGNGPDLVRFRLEASDASGAPIATTTAGSDFILNVYSDDLRDDGAGVYAGYLDILFDSTLVATNGNVAFGDDYPAGQIPRDGFVGDVAGEFDEYGAFAGFTTEIGAEERLLFSVPMTAVANGAVEFTSNAADVTPKNEVLLLDIQQPIPTSRIEYGSITLTIGGEIQAAFTNPNNRFDVNDDGAVSARDALILVNSINEDGARPLDGSASSISGFYLDVNQDMSLSAIDVLQVINHINFGAAEPEPAAMAAAIDAVFDADGEDEEEGDFLV